MNSTLKIFVYLALGMAALVAVCYVIKTVYHSVADLSNWVKTHAAKVRSVVGFVLLSLFVLSLGHGNPEILFTFLFLMAFYYFLLWLFVSRKPLKHHGKPYRLALFVLGCYWGCWITYAAMHDYIRNPDDYNLTKGGVDLINSILLSIFFFGAVYVYQHYVKDE